MKQIPTFPEFKCSNHKIVKNIDGTTYVFYMSKEPICNTLGLNVYKLLITMSRGKRRFIYDKTTITDVVNGGVICQNEYMYL